MNIFFMGTPEFAVPTLDILNKSQDENISTSLAANRIAEKRIKEESLKSK